MKIAVKHKGAVLAERADLASGLLARMKGLLGRSELCPGEGLIISPCSSVHTFGMRFPIDAVFYGRDNRALGLVKELKPCRISGWYPRAAGVVEVPAGTIAGLPLEVGDELVFI